MKNLKEETLFLSMNIKDRYLNIKSIEDCKLKIFSLACLFVASKYEEIYFPSVNSFIKTIKENFFNNPNSFQKRVDEFLGWEYEILSTLNFDILHTTPYIFLMRLNEISGNDKNIFYLAEFFLEFSFFYNQLNVYSSLLKACSALYIARFWNLKNGNIRTIWTYDLQKFCNIQEIEIKECSETILYLIGKTQNLKKNILIQKYSQESKNVIFKKFEDKI